MRSVVSSAAFCLALLPAWAFGQVRTEEGTHGQPATLPNPHPLPAPHYLLREQAPPAPPPLAPLPPPPPPPPPAADVEARASEPTTEPGAYLHDGFYLRIGVGAGWVSERIEWTPKGGTTASSAYSTGAVPIEFALGGTLGKGFVLGGALNTLLLGKRPRKDLPLPDGEKKDEHAATLSTFGLFADWYPVPDAGFHLQGMLAGATLLLADTADSDYAPSGASLSVGVGHAWWTAPETSLGILGRVDWASLLYEQDDPEIKKEFEHRFLHIGLMGTATFH